MTKNVPAVSIRNLTFAYEKAPVLEDVDLVVQRGEFVCVLGPNGGGKTTLLKIILGLLKPQRGEVRVFGQSPEKVRFRMGYVPQHARFDAQFPITLMEVILLGLLDGKRPIGWFREPERRAAAEALSAVGLLGKANEPFSHLSGGEQQRGLIARALVGEPDLLLLDEPTSNLDLHVESVLRDLLRSLKRRITVITVSHDLGFVSDQVESVVCVKRNVVQHPTEKLTPGMIDDIYGREVRFVNHDHHSCRENEPPDD